MLTEYRHVTNILAWHGIVRAMHTRRAVKLYCSVTYTRIVGTAEQFDCDGML